MAIDRPWDIAAKIAVGIEPCGSAVYSIYNKITNGERDSVNELAKDAIASYAAILQDIYSIFSEEEIQGILFLGTLVQLELKGLAEPRQREYRVSQAFRALVNHYHFAEQLTSGLRRFGAEVTEINIEQSFSLPRYLLKLAQLPVVLSCARKDFSNIAYCDVVLKKAEESFLSLQNTRKTDISHFVEAIMPEDCNTQILLYSFLLQVTFDSKYFTLLAGFINSDKTTFHAKNNIYRILVRTHFVFRELQQPGNAHYLRICYRTLFTAWKESIPKRWNWLPYASRNKNSIVILTTHFFYRRYAPCKIIMAHCAELQKMGWDVTFINVASTPHTLSIPLYNPWLVPRASELDHISQIGVEVDGVVHSFPFYQCKDILESASELEAVIDAIYQINPEWIYCIGEHNLLGDFCSEFTTVAVSSLLYAGFPITVGSIPIIFRKLGESDEEILLQEGLKPQDVVEAKRTLRVEKTEKNFVRADFAIPESVFAITIVGNRLDQEVNATFARELERLLKNNPEVFLVFIGSFTKYDELCNQYQSFKSQSVSIGYQKELLATYATCDAYMDTPRQGGGFSALIAMIAGLPVMTLPGGDVAGVAGENFQFTAFSDMEQYVRWCIADNEFYQEQRRRASRRAAELLDSKAAVTDMMGKLRHKAMESG